MHCGSLVSLIHRSLGSLVSLSSDRTHTVMRGVVGRRGSSGRMETQGIQGRGLGKELSMVSEVVPGLCMSGTRNVLSSSQLDAVVGSLRGRTTAVGGRLSRLDSSIVGANGDSDCGVFFRLAGRCSRVSGLSHSALLAFIREVRINPGVLPRNVRGTSRQGSRFRRSMGVFCGFIKIPGRVTGV